MEPRSSNSARLVYTLACPDGPTDGIGPSWPPVCRLRRTGLLLRREARSDEKVRFSDAEMGSVVRTVLFLYVFRTGPLQSIGKIARTGTVTYPRVLAKTIPRDRVSLRELADLLDRLIGPNFSLVARYAVTRHYHEYQQTMRYYPYVTARCRTPSAADYLTLDSFINARADRYSPAVRFLLSNITDHRTPLQGAVKRLPPPPTGGRDRERIWSRRCNPTAAAVVESASKKINPPPEKGREAGPTGGGSE